MIKLFTSGVFWGVLLLLIGADIVLKTVLKIDIHLFSLLIASIFIYLGYIIITGRFSQFNMFGYNKIRYDSDNPQSEYNIMFGAGIIDLTGIKPQSDKEKISINVIFGASKLAINPDIPLRIKASSAFGGIRLPDKTGVSFGDTVYKTASFDRDKPFADIKISVVFGGAKFYTDSEKLNTKDWEDLSRED